MSQNQFLSLTAVEPAIGLASAKVKAPRTTNVSSEALSIGPGILAFLGAHVLIGFVVHNSSAASAVHALITLAIGMYVALFDRRLERVAYVGAYIVGGEVLWHMTEAPILWEFGKYSIVAIFITAILANRLVKAPALPVFYFVLLVPSIWITLIEEDFTSRSEDFQSGRDMISFNMSGPLALMVSAWFLSNIKLTRVQIQRLFLAALGPIVSISAIALTSVTTSADIGFGTTSNTTASGGFGPNQVSSILGLGALLSFLFFVLSNRTQNNKNRALAGRVISWVRRFLMILMMVLFIAQSALTFSRGGLYNTMAGLAIGFFFLMRQSRSRIQLILVAVFLLGFSVLILFPKLNQFTGGTLENRFENTSTTGREDFMAYQMKVFERHPLFGLGPGRGFWGASHTEYTRLLSDHGLLGVVALILLFAMAIVSIKRARTMMSKAIVASVLAWSFVFMAHVGMRIVAPSFLIGLSFATMMREESKSKIFRRQKQVQYQDNTQPILRAAKPTGVL